MVKIQSITLGVALTSSWGYFATAVGCYPSYIPGSTYSIGTWVSSSITSTTNITYTVCSPPGEGSCPTNGFIQEGGVSTTTSYNFQCHSEYWCSANGYSPESIYSEYAWTKESEECTGTATEGPGVGNESSSPTQSPIYVTLTDLGGCPTEFNESSNYEAGDKVSKNGIVFQCQVWPQSLFCSQTRFEPDYESKSENWKEAWTVLGYCTGTDSPTEDGTAAPTLSPSTFPPNTDSPTGTNVGGCPMEWAAGGSMTYVEDDKVSVLSSDGSSKLVYKCKAWPKSAYCGQFSPIDATGGKLGWEYVGGCTGTISPTSSPTYDASSIIAGCPVAYNAASTYHAGDKVSRTVSTNKQVVYQCREWPGSVYCNQKSFSPGSEYDYMAWTVLGPCEGTIAPTESPTSYGGTCTYDKVVDAIPTPSPVMEWMPDSSYEAGDQVRIGLTKFECMPWPYYFWCRIAAYAPTLDDTGSWTEAWAPAGLCDP